MGGQDTVKHQTQQRALLYQTRLNKDRMDRRCLLSGVGQTRWSIFTLYIAATSIVGGSNLCGKYIEIWNAENTKQAAECFFFLLNAEHFTLHLIVLSQLVSEISRGTK